MSKKLPSKMKLMYGIDDALEFNLTPLKIKEYLKRYIIGQEDAKDKVATAVRSHYLRLKSKKSDKDYNLKKHNILLIGPHGVGKTLLAEKIADLVTVPFKIAVASSFSTTGYEGDSVDNIFVDLLMQVKDYRKAEKAIIYIDEIDKIRERKTFGPDVRGLDVQHELLRFVEGTEMQIEAEENSFVFSTKDMLFICGGTFEGLEECIRDRVGYRKIGFTSQFYEKNLLNKVLTDDLIAYGMNPQLLRRIAVVAVLHPLSVEDLRKIFVEPEDSLLKKYKDEFKEEMKIELEMTKCAEKLIAEKAYKENLGASGLEKVCEEIFLKYKLVLPDAQNINKLIIDAKTVNDPVGELRRLLKRTSNQHLLKELK